MQGRRILYLNQCSRDVGVLKKACDGLAPKNSSRPTVPCDGPRMNRQVDVGNPPRPFRHLRMTERRTPDPSSSRVPVHSALVQKSVTAITNSAGRLSIWMLGKSRALGKWKTAKRWQAACNESNARFTQCACQKLRLIEAPGIFTLLHARSPSLQISERSQRKTCGERKGVPLRCSRTRKYLILLTGCEFIFKNKISGPERSRRRVGGTPEKSE